MINPTDHNGSGGPDDLPIDGTSAPSADSQTPGGQTHGGQAFGVQGHGDAGSYWPRAYGAQQFGAQPYGAPPYGVRPYGQPYVAMQPYGQAPLVARKDPTLMLIASFFIPGLGTILNGETGKGVGILAGYLIGIPLIFILIGIPMTMGFWIWGMVDAYRGAQNHNARHGLP